MTYEQIIQKAGKRIVPRVFYYENSKEISLARDDFKQAKFKYNASLVGTVMSSVELELKTTLPNKEIYIEITAQYGSETQKKVYGGYLRRNEPVYNADTKTYTYELYDKIITTMVDYKPITISYPTTVFDFFKQLLKELNFTTDISSLPNGSRVIEKDIYSGIDYTYRDVLNDIGQATATLFVIEENKIKKCSFGTSTLTINDDILKNQNITLGKHFGPINTIVLTRSGNSDSIYYPKTLPSNPIEFRIADNQLMNENDREDYLADIYNQLKGIEFDVYDTALVGYGGFAPLSKIKISTNGKEYNSYVFNNEITISQGYEEVIYTEMPEESATDYKASDTTDRKVNQVYIIARKLEKEIVAVVDTTNKIAKEVNPTKIVNGSNIYLDDASNSELINLQIEGKSWQKVKSGKNVAKINDFEVTIKGVTLTCKEGELNINGQATDVIRPKEFESYVGNFKLYAGLYTFSTKYISGSARVNVDGFVTAIMNSNENSTIYSTETNGVKTGETTEIEKCYVGFNILKNSYFEDYKWKVQLEEGDVATEWVEGGNMPSPDEPSEIESVGYENLFDINSITENYLYEDGGIFTPATTYNTSDYISCKSNEFIVSAKFTAYNPYIRYIIAEFDENKTYIQRQLNTDSSSPKYTFTLNDNTKYIRLCYRNDATLYDIQIEKGSVAHSYISYGKYGIEVETVGKNLFDYITRFNNSMYGLTNTINNNGSITVAGIPTGNYAEIVRRTDITNSLKNGKTYKLYQSHNDENVFFEVRAINKLTGTIEKYYQRNVSFIANTVNYTYDIGLLTYTTSSWGTQSRTITGFYQLEEGTNSTDFEKYRNSKTLFILNEPLRSLPNGVKDKAYIRNNKLYVDRYIGSVVLNGSEEWRGGAYSTNSTKYRYFFRCLLFFLQLVRLLNLARLLNC